MTDFHDINGRIVKAEDALISVFDIGLLRGYGIFDFFPVKSGYPIFIEDYYNRFFASASRMKLVPPVDRIELHERVVRIILHNKMQDGYVKLVLTGGSAPDGYTPQINNLYILKHDPVSYSDHYFKVGIRLILQDYQRAKPTIKSLNYANAILHRDLTQSLEATDLLYHDGRNIQETSRANFFLIDKNNVLRTNPDITLHGITRKHLIALAKSNGLKVEENQLPLEEITRAREAFITSTTKALIPVRQINDHHIALGSQMTITNKLRSAFLQHIDQYVLDAQSASSNHMLQP